MRVARDALEQAAVDARHRAGARRAAPVDGGEQPQPAAVPLAGAVGLELDQVREPRAHGLGCVLKGFQLAALPDGFSQRVSQLGKAGKIEALVKVFRGEGTVVGTLFGQELVLD